MLLFQPDSGAAAGGAPLSQGFSGFMEMMGNVRPVAMGVLVLLLIASLYSWTVILGKISLFGKATKESRRFIRAFRKATRLQEIAAIASDYSTSPLAQVFEDVYETYKRQTGGYGPPHNLVPLERSAQTAASEAVTKMEGRLTWLATIASVSPFVGLFGTVVGIIDAFVGLGTAGAATLRAVAPGIAEALFATAIGLVAAIPATIFYNMYSSDAAKIGTRLENFADEFSAIISRQLDERA